MLYTVHARERMQKERIAEAWVETTISYPDFVRPDRVYPHRTNAFRRIPEFRNRWIRVVYEYMGPEIVVVTAFPDRNAEKRRRTSFAMNRALRSNW